MCIADPCRPPERAEDDEAAASRADAMTVSPAAEMPRCGADPMTRQGESTTMTKNQDADVLDARDVVRKDPLTLLRAIYVALDMLDDELGNDTDMSAAVGDVIEAKKHVKEAIDTLEHLYDFPILRGILKIMGESNARKPSELGDAPTSPPSDVAVGSVPAGGSDGRRALIRLTSEADFTSETHSRTYIWKFDNVADARRQYSAISDYIHVYAKREAAKLLHKDIEMYITDLKRQDIKDDVMNVDCHEPIFPRQDLSTTALRFVDRDAPDAWNGMALLKLYVECPQRIYHVWFHVIIEKGDAP